MAAEAAPAHRATPNFDRIAAPYRWLEYLTFGPLLQRTRTHFLEPLSGCRRALVLGDGDGRFTAALLGRWPEMRVHAIDGSAAMLRALNRRCSPHAARLTTEQADLRDWSPAPDAGYDLVATHFCLDCLSTGEVARLAARVGQAAAGGALWLVSDFAVPQSQPGRWAGALLVGLLYQTFGLLTGLAQRRLPDHACALTAAGWALDSEVTRLGGLLTSQVWRRMHGDPASPCESGSSHSEATLAPAMNYLETGALHPIDEPERLSNVPEPIAS